MKTFLAILCFSIPVLLFSQYDSISHNSLNRTFLTHIPTSYNASTAVPLVLALHGGFGSGSQLEAQSLLSAKSDQEGFIVVYPEGVKGTLSIRTWNGGGCCGYARDNKIDDVGFISDLLDTLQNRYLIDTTRIYVTGMSNGGFMTYRLACELSNRIAAIAPVASTMAVDICNTVRPVPVIHFHSELDSSIPYLGGVGNGASNHYNPPHDSVFEAWSNKNSCININDTLNNDTNYMNVLWSDCACNSEISYFLTKDGGHSWPGGVKPTPFSDDPSTVINANDLMWSFFQKHTLNCDDSITAIFEPNVHIPGVYPNPADKNIYIMNLVSSSPQILVQITDVFGIVQYSGLYQTHNIMNIRIDVSIFSSGIYFLNVIQSGKVFNKKLIISR